MRFLIITLLQIYCWICQWKSFKSRSIFDELMDKSIMFPFFDSQCTYMSSSCDVV